jgi:hypothetical protein
LRLQRKIERLEQALPEPPEDDGYCRCGFDYDAALAELLGTGPERCLRCGRPIYRQVLLPEEANRMLAQLVGHEVSEGE